MPFSFLPKIITDKLTDITPELLRARNIRLLMLDFDNTIVPYTTNVPTAKMEQWLVDMLSSEIQLCVVSNSKRDRVKIFCEKYGIPCITHAKKPFTKGIRKCLECFGIPADQSALVGDQIFTDLWGGSFIGMYTILVKPINPREEIQIVLKRILERPILWLYRHSRSFSSEHEIPGTEGENG